MSGNVIGRTTFTYDSRGETIKSVTTDKDGKVTKTTENEYYNSGVQRSKTTIKYASDGSYTKTVVSYSESGEKTGTRVEKYDKNGNIISLVETSD